MKLEDGEDVEILENILNLGNIQTPLYNPQVKLDENKINTLIVKNFSDEAVEIPEALAEFVSKARLVDMLDFSRKEFSKALGLSPKKIVAVKSQWELLQLKDTSELITKGTTPTSIGFSFVENGVNFIKIESITKSGKFIKSRFAHINSDCNKAMLRSQLKENDVLFSIAGALGRTVIVDKNILPANTNQALAIIRLKKDSLLHINYLYLILQSAFIQEQIGGLKVGVAQPNLSLTQIGDFKIPLPPLEIQKEIVKACEVIDSSVDKANTEIEKVKNEIDWIVKSINGEIVKLVDITDNLSNLRVPITQRDRIKGDIPYYGASGIVDYVSDFIVNDYVLLVSEDGANLKTRNTPIAFTVEGKAWVNNHAHILKFKNKITHKLSEYILNRMDINSFITGQAQPKLNQKNLHEIKISLPSIEKQKEIVLKIQILEEKIKKSQLIVESASDKKQEILNKYL